MKTRILLRSIPFAILAALMSPAFADEPDAQPVPVAPAPALRQINVEGAKFDHVRHFLGGFRNTIVFITIPEQQAVVKLVVDPTSREFPTMGQVILFTQDTNAEMIAKWINNQHSCGLFPDVAEPVFTGNLPEGCCVVIDREKVGEAIGPMDQAPYHDYKLKISVKAHTEPGRYSLQAFEIETAAYLKIITL